jgi:hypothetical protein
MSSRLSLLTVAAAVAMALAGCSQTTGLSGPSGVASASGYVAHSPVTLSQSGVTPSQSGVTPSQSGVTLSAVEGRSWMNPAAKKSDLLYLDDQTGNVYVYSYPKGVLMGTLTGLPEPQGECVDKKGDVFFTTFASEEILEYAHGGTSPINTLSNPGQYMEGCSVDKTTGDLAAVDFEPSGGGGGGGVAIFAKASGTPTVLTDSNLYLGYQIGYDNKGNIFVDGVDDSRNFEFAELPKGSSSFTEIALNSVSITTPGGVQWDGKYVTVGDAKNGNIYQTDGAGGNVEGTTSLSESDGIFQYFIDGKKVVGPNVYSANVGIWKYPKGGTPTKTLTGFAYPFGAAVSKAPKK